MNSLVLAFVLVAAAVLADPVQDRWNRVHQQCQQSPDTHVPEEIFAQLKRNERPILPANFGLHANCMLVRLDLQDQQGNILSEGVKQAAQKQYSDAAKVAQIVKDCSVSGSTKEESASALFGCLGKNRVNIGQL